MIKLSTVIHDIASNTLEASFVEETIDANGNIERQRVKCRNYHPLQRDEFLADCGGTGQKYSDLAGWTDEYLASVRAEEERIAAEVAAKEAAAKAERDAAAKAEREAAAKAAFDAEVARQVDIMKAAQAALESGA